VLLFLNTRIQPFLLIAAISPSGTPIVTAHLLTCMRPALNLGARSPVKCMYDLIVSLKVV